MTDLIIDITCLIVAYKVMTLVNVFLVAMETAVLYATYKIFERL